MASITLTVPNAVVPRITNSIGYNALLPDGSPNPVSATQAIKDFLANDIKAQVKAFESPTVSATAVTANNQSIDASIINYVTMATPKVDYHRINSLKAKVYDCMARIEDAMAIVEQCKKEISQHNAAISDEIQKQKAATSKK